MLLGTGWPGEGLLAGKGEPLIPSHLQLTADVQRGAPTRGDTGLITRFFPSRALRGSLLPGDQRPNCWPNVWASTSRPYLSVAFFPVYITPRASCCHTCVHMQLFPIARSLPGLVPLPGRPSLLLDILKPDLAFEVVTSRCLSGGTTLLLKANSAPEGSSENTTFLTLRPGLQSRPDHAPTLGMGQEFRSN